MGSIIGSLRPAHWIGIGLAVAVLGGGSLSKGFGLLSAKATEAERLASCLERRHIDMATLASSVGDPATLLEGGTGRNGEQAIRTAARHGQLARRDATAAIDCIREITR